MVGGVGLLELLAREREHPGDIGGDVAVADHDDALPRGDLRLRRADRPPDGIPGEDLPGLAAATEFVAWYNGHPDFRDLDFDLSGPTRGDHRQRQRRDRLSPACSRWRADELAKTDVADHALEVLRDSASARSSSSAAAARPRPPSRTRSCASSATCADADVIVDPAEMRASTRRAPCRSRGGRADRTAATSRSSRVRRPRAAGAAPSASHCASCARRSRSRATARVERIEIGRTTSSTSRTTGRSAPAATDRREMIDCGLVLRSIGYKGVARCPACPSTSAAA